MYSIRYYPNHFPVKASHNRSSPNTSFETRVEQLGKSEYTEIELEKWQIHHQVGKAFDGKGWLEDGSMYDLIAISEEVNFPCFVQDKQYLYTSETTKVVSEQAIKRLRNDPDSPNPLHAIPVEINLNSLKEYILTKGESAIKGGWFREMNVANVEVAYLGGGSVTESSDWERYEASGGMISALRIDIPIDSEDINDFIKVLLTKDGNCVIYKQFGEMDLLKISMPLFQIAKDYLVK